jgi:hypothetical protein
MSPVKDNSRFRGKGRSFSEQSATLCPLYCRFTLGLHFDYKNGDFSTETSVEFHHLALRYDPEGGAALCEGHGQNKNKFTFAGHRT